MNFLKTSILLLAMSATGKSGFIHSGGSSSSYFFNPQHAFHLQQPFVQYPHYQNQQVSPFQQYPSHVSQNQFVSVNRPQFVAVSAPQHNLQQNHQIHQVSSAAASIPIQHHQQPSNNIFAIHSASVARKIVLPLIHTTTHKRPNPNYSFGYAVNDASTGDQKSHQETRRGDNVIGKYTVVDPDGNLRVVSYTAGKDGFNAIVEKTPGYARPNAPEINKRIVSVPRPVNFISHIPVNSFAVPVSSVPSYAY